MLVYQCVLEGTRLLSESGYNSNCTRLLSSFTWRSVRFAAWKPTRGPHFTTTGGPETRESTTAGLKGKPVSN